jgi:hypothetical protein
MSVYDPEPKIPNSDSGKGLRVIGWLLLIWTGIMLVWTPPNQWVTNYMPVVTGLCFVGGIGFVIAGYVVAWRTPREEVLQERAHDLMEASEDGAIQHDKSV